MASKRLLSEARRASGSRRKPGIGGSPGMGVLVMQRDEGSQAALTASPWALISKLVHAKEGLIRSCHSFSQSGKASPRFPP